MCFKIQSVYVTEHLFLIQHFINEDSVFYLRLSNILFIQQLLYVLYKGTFLIFLSLSNLIYIHKKNKFHIRN